MWAKTLWPVSHGRFEKMCALAVTGQLGGAQMCELDKHVAACGRCRKYFQSIAQLSVQVMSILADKHARERRLRPPLGMRERFLARLAAEPFAEANAKMPRSLAADGAAAQERQGFTIIVEERPRQQRETGKVSPLSLWRPVAIGTWCLIAVVVAFYAGRRTRIPPPPQVSVVRPVSSPTPPILTKPAESDRVSALEIEKSKLETKLAATERELATAQSEQEVLSKELTAAKEKLTSRTKQAANRPAQDSPQVQQTNDLVSNLQADLSRLSQRLAESEIKIDIENQERADLSSRLALTEVDLQQARDLKSAKSEMGELAASRNLHIVDVYDADANGKRQRSFGRVFYVEGQSLVFYAYDLDGAVRFQANVVFHVWGGKAGVKEVTHSLGILRKDDSGQNRWAMTFDDSNVLAQINSVFVTAETANRQYDSPHGKKILYAYFGSPANHP